jgi:hypothetical protein
MFLDNFKLTVDIANDRVPRSSEIKRNVGSIPYRLPFIGP